MIGFVDEPRVERLLGSRAPLVAILRFAVAGPVTTTVRIDDARAPRTVTFDATHRPADGLALLGLRADTGHAITVTASNDGDSTGPVTLSYPTPALPQGTRARPRFTLVRSTPGRMEPGYTLASISLYPAGVVERREPSR